MVNPPEKRMDSRVQTVSSIDFELDEDLPDMDITDGSVVTDGKEKLECRKRQLRLLCDANSHLYITGTEGTTTDCSPQCVLFGRWGMRRN